MIFPDAIAFQRFLRDAFLPFGRDLPLAVPLLRERRDGFLAPAFPRAPPFARFSKGSTGTSRVTLTIGWFENGLTSPALK
jgi:hypothetical protein